MSPLEFMQRLTALVPQPRLHLIRLYGVLPPNADLWAVVVPNGPEQATGRSEFTVTETDCAHGQPARISCSQLLMRVFQIDLEHCPNCVRRQDPVEADQVQPGPRHRCLKGAFRSPGRPGAA